MMATLTKTVRLATKISDICKSIKSIHISSEPPAPYFNFSRKLSPLFSHQKCNFHTTVISRDLMEFFDNEKNWGSNEIKTGRAWKKDELRIKSNSDLHKLWFLLLKEKNMLLTMEYECNDKMELFPSPERIDKVTESMKNLEEIVRERNKAYHLLETGENGERPGKYVTNSIGRKFYYRACEHMVPPYMNQNWLKTRKFGYEGRAAKKFIMLYNEKIFLSKKKSKNRDRNHVIKLLRRYPNTNLEVLKEKYPSVDITKLLKDDKVRGHFVPKIN